MVLHRLVWLDFSCPGRKVKGKGNCTVWFILLAAVMMNPVQKTDPPDFGKNVLCSLSKWCDIDPKGNKFTSPFGKLLEILKEKRVLLLFLLLLSM